MVQTIFINLKNHTQMRKIFFFLAMLATMAATAEVSVRVENQKMVLNNNGQETILTPNGADASYFWCSVSPDEKHLVYTTAHLGTYVCDLNGENVQCMGRMNAPKWLDNEHVAGMQEFYNAEDEVDNVRYICRNLKGRQTRDLTMAERSNFIQQENARLAALKVNHMQRAARRNGEATTGLSGLKIYVNPGHGGHDSNDRSCWTIPVPELWSNPNGYWESNSNLTKGLALRDLLEGAGATVIMSRTTNNSGIRDKEYYPNATPEQLQELQNGDDRDLSAIAEEANANNVDHFISVHSNALNSQTNYLLMLYHGETGAPTVAESDAMAASSGAIQIQNPLTVWTTTTPLLRGDLTFYGDDMGLGVLRPLTVPGFLSEGSFHDYPPETHRLMNADYCKLEAMRMYQHFHRYFNRALPQTATISGWVKSSNQTIDDLNQPKFFYLAGTDDQWMPINGALVELMQGDNVLQSYTTDEWYNGIFAFYDITPGDYTVRVTKENYKTVIESVTVAAEDIAGVKVRMKNIHMDTPNFVDEENDAMPLDSYEFVAVGDTMTCPAGMSRILYRNGRIYTMEAGAIFSYDLNMGDRQAIAMPAEVTLCDFAFSSDDYLFAKQAGTTAIYMWDDEMLNPAVCEATAANADDNYLVVSGPHWNATVHTAATMIALAIDGSAFACENEAAYLRYAHHSYRAEVVKEEANIQFQLMDVEPAAAVAVSDATPAEPMVLAQDGFAGLTAWTDGYEMHVVIACEGLGILHFKTLSTPTLNIYAGECSFKDDKFSFRLNENATAVTLAIESEGEIIKSQDLGAMSKGMHVIDNPFGSTEFDAFIITPVARQIAFLTKVSDDSHPFQFYAPRGVAVDNTPESPFFGRIYITESVGGQCSEDWYGTNPDQRAVTQGVYVLGSDFSDVTNQGNDAYNGNINWGTNAGVSYQFALGRPAVAPDGKVFIPNSTVEACGLYIMDPAAPSADFQPVFSGKYVAGLAQLKKGKNVVCNEVMHAVILGTGKDEVLYTYDRDVSGSVSGCIWQYNIGELDSLPWSAKPTKVFFENATQDNHMQNSNGQMAYDGRGGFFMSQYRYNSSWAVPGLIHVNSEGIKDFNISNNGVDAVQQGGMAVSPDGSILALGTELGYVKVWDVTYDNAGAPTLAEKCIIPWYEPGGKGNTYGISIDVAGNIYIVSNSNERLMVYALPNLNNSHSTRIVTKQRAAGLESVNHEMMNNGVRKLMHQGHLLIIRDGKIFNAQGMSMN